jgi:branched-chain amino acid transport system permease protein
MHVRRTNPLKEILKPLGLLFVFVVGSSIVISAIVLLLAYLLQGTRDDMDMMQITLILLPQVLIDGLVLGFMYATIALGYTMVYGVLEFINFAHGEFFMFGAFAGVGLLNWLDESGRLAGASTWLSYVFLFMAILAGMIVAGALSGTTERFAYRPLRGAPRLVPLIAAIGVSFFLQDLMRFYQSAVNGVFYQTFPDFGNFSERITLFQVPYGDRTIDISIQIKSIIIILVAIIMLVALNYLVNATRLGKAIRSVAQDQRTSSLMGINVNRIIAMTFVIGGALGGAAGVLWAFKFTRADPYMGFFPGLKAFTAAVLGGIGVITGAMLGGIVLGLLESFAAAYMSIFTDGRMGAEYKDIFTFGILILILVFRPSGLLGGKVAQKA